MKKAARSAIWSTYSDEICRKPCHSEEFNFYDRLLPVIGDENLTQFSAYFDTIKVEQRYEYEFYDLNTIIGIIGGSMGLFLGFSFYQFVVVVVDYVGNGFLGALKRKMTDSLPYQG